MHNRTKQFILSRACCSFPAALIVQSGHGQANREGRKQKGKNNRETAAAYNTKTGNSQNQAEIR